MIEIQTKRLILRPWQESDAEIGYWLAKPYWNQDDRPVHIMRLDYAL